MKKVGYRSEAGFTLVELLVVMSIISILGSLSMQMFGELRERTYYTISESMLKNIRTAMENGKVDSDSFGSSTISFTQSVSGPVYSTNAQTLTPGLTLPEDFQVFVWHDPSCAGETDSWCLEDYIQSRHCESDELVYYYKYSNGHEHTVKNYGASWSC